MDDALRRRLDAIERRQRVVLALVLVPYVLGGLAAIPGAFSGVVGLVAGVAVLLVAFLAIAYAGYHGRPSRR